MTDPERPRLDVSVILPTFNERDNIAPLIEAILRVVPGRREILVVDDDSPDETWRAAGEAAASRPEVRVLRRIGARGLTSALRHGFAAAQGDVIVWLDCDFSMPPAAIPRLLDEVARGADAAVGSRFVPGARVRIAPASHGARRAVRMSALLNRFIGAVLGGPLTDFTSGFIAIRREALERAGLRGDYGEYFIGLVHRARKLGYRIVEVPYDWVERRAGVSKTASGWLGALRRGRKYVWTTLRLRFTKIR